jgi:membrane fusion protein (multidrug efflux system)
VRVTVKGPQREAVLVPESAVVQRGDGALVYVVVDNKAKQVRVSLGKRLDGKVEVLNGIAAGDAVVTAGNARLSDGAEVEVVSAAAAAE